MYLSENQIVVLQQFFKTKPVLNAYLFGSYARGEADEQSDVDILVDLDHTLPIGLKFFDISDDLEKIMNRKIDLVPSDAVSPFLKKIIESEKKLLYERGIE